MDRDVRPLWGGVLTVSVDNGVTLQPGVTKILIRGSGASVRYVTADTIEIDLSSSGSQTPWASDIDAAGFDLIAGPNRFRIRSDSGTDIILNDDGSVVLHASNSSLTLNPDGSSTLANDTLAINSTAGTIPDLVAALAAAQRTIRRTIPFSAFADDGNGNGIALVYTLPEGGSIKNGGLWVTTAFDDSGADNEIHVGALDPASLAAGFSYISQHKSGADTQIIGNQLNDGGGGGWADRVISLPGGVPLGVYLPAWGNDGTTGVCIVELDVCDSPVIVP